jgi:hypothetical protein
VQYTQSCVLCEILFQAQPNRFLGSTEIELRSYSFAENSEWFGDRKLPVPGAADGVMLMIGKMENRGFPPLAGYVGAELFCKRTMDDLEGICMVRPV